MTPKRGFIIWFLILFFAWAIMKEFGTVMNYEISTDYNVFNAWNVSWAFFAASSLSLVLGLLTFIFLIFPRPYGYWFGISYMIFGGVVGIFSFILSITDIELVKNFYRSSREARGLTVNEEALNGIFSFPGMALSCVLFIVYVGFIIYLFRRRRSYFFQQT